MKAKNWPAFSSDSIYLGHEITNRLPLTILFISVETVENLKLRFGASYEL